MIKSAWVYYQRYAIVKRGFCESVDEIDDFAYLIELVKNNATEQEIVKVVSRMGAQNAIDDKNKYLYFWNNFKVLSFQFWHLFIFFFKTFSHRKEQRCWRCK